MIGCGSHGEFQLRTGRALALPSERNKARTPGTVSYNAAVGTIYFKPNGALRYDARYTLVLENLKATNGLPQARTEYSFTTYINPAVKSLSYSNGKISSYKLTRFDNRHRKTQQISYRPGIDGIAQTRDDEISNATVWNYAAGRLPVQETQLSDSGADKIWLNADDSIFMTTRYEYDVDGTLATITWYGAPGDDGVWNTADDLPMSREELDAQNNPVYFSMSTDTGPDGEYRTADDRINDYTKSYYDSTGQTVITAAFHSPGPDGIWLTTDDEIDSYTRFAPTSFDPNLPEKSEIILVVTYKNAGTDGVWFTDDDVVASYVKSTKSGDAPQISRDISVDGPGVDQIWFTADDNILDYLEKRNTSDGLKTTSIGINGPGPDMQWFTQDDSVNFYNVSQRNAARDHSQNASYDGPGNDAIWLTADDRLRSTAETVSNRKLQLISNHETIHYDGPNGRSVSTRHRTIQYDNRGNRLSDVTATDPGPDGQWQTADDILANETTFASTF